MLSSIFEAIQFIFSAIGIWDQWLNYIDQKRIAEMEDKNQKRSDALDAITSAQEEASFDKAQDDIVNNKP